MARPLGFTSYEIENDKKLARALSRASKVITNLETPLKQIAADFRKSRKAIFALQSAGQYPDLSSRPMNAFWEKDPKLRRAAWRGGSKSYKYAKYGFAYPILKATGRLEKSLTDRNSPDHIEDINIDEMKIGTKVEYGIFHQEGTSRIPIRKFLFIGPEAPRFAKGDALKGFPERALNTLNSYILRQTGLSIEESTGVKPRIKK